MKLVKILIAGTAVMLTAPAFAAEYDWHQNSWHPSNGCSSWSCQTGESTIVNHQTNHGIIYSKLNADVNNSGGDVNLTATAVGNTVEVLTMQDTEVDTTQINTGLIGSQVNAGVDSVDGNVNISSTALCNGADVSTDPNVTVVNNSQTCGAADPEASINASVTNITGGVGMSAVAIGNQLTTDSNAAHFPVSNNQTNQGGVVATVNANVANVNHVELSATAIGNTAQIVHVNTDP